MSSDFVHLHVHTEFSLLDGQSQIKDLVSRAAELEMPAVGITDHGVMFGVIDFYRAAKNAGLKPVIGMEAYLAPRKLTDKDAKLDKRPYHMLLLAKNQEGYQNLMQLASVAQLEGYYYRPRIDWEHMEKHSSGLIATSGCLAAEIPRMIEEGRDDEARQQIGKYKEVFGEDNFYLELQPHDIDKLGVLNRWLHDYRKSGHTNVGFLATNDVHYVRREDHDAHDTLLCIQTSAHKSDEKRMKMSPHDSYYLKTTDEMYEEFRRRGLPEDIIRESFANSLKVAQMTDLNLDVDEYRLPIFPVPPRFGEGDNATRDYLRYLVEMGLSWRYPGREDDAVLQERMERELGIIDNMGFNTYFLIVWDLCEFARHADIWWNVRGSGAASLVAYSLGITNIDPIQNSLLFERFLNPGRVSMPDIDLDYPDNRRAEMIAYTADKYGKDKVAAIITFGTMGAKASVKDVGRALDVDLAKINHATSLIPQEARQKKLEVYIESNPELQQLYNSDDEVRRVMETAKKLQGMTRHASTHAAGVIVADKDLREYVPLHRITGTDPSGGSLNAVTQFPMETAESIGLLKVDFLGLSTLTILRKACDLINRHHGTNYTIDNIPYRHDDSRNPLTDEQLHMLDEAFELMGRGETVGVFQVESPGMQAMLRGMRPKKFENIIAGISLYRPGPMEFIPNYNKRLHGEEDVPYKHDKLRPILEETYGILVYQEQIMQVAGELFGYDLGEADLMRRAVSKKKAKALAEHKAIFMERGPQNGISQQVAEEIFDEIEFFANYGFNKCLVGSTEITDSQTGRVVTLDDLYQGHATVTQTVTCETDSLRLQHGQITDVLFNGVKPVYTLTTRTGRTITATGNHPFYTFEGWRTLDELTPGDRLAVPRRLPVEGQKEWPEYKLIVLGHLLAEGNLCHPTGIYYYTNDEEQWQDYVTNLNLFENTVASTHRRRESSHDVYGKRIDRSTSSGATTWIESLGLKDCNSYKKFIPEEVFELTNSQIGLLISRMWEGDGHINEKGRSLFYATSSKRMVYQLQHLLLRLDIPGSIREVEFPYKDGRTGYQLFITGNDNFQRFAEKIGVYFISETRKAILMRMCLDAPANSGTKDNIPIDVKVIVRRAKDLSGRTWKQIAADTGLSMSTFSRIKSGKKVGYTHAIISQLAEYFDNDELRRYAENDIYWDDIVSIEYAGEEPTYDLTIADTHNFIANDVLVHNSHATDYAVITVQSAFLKQHYPHEFMTALLCVQFDDSDKVSTFLEECRRLNIDVLPPHINNSQIDFDIEEQPNGARGIRFGLGAIKNAGVGALRHIIDEREENGAFESLTDFCHRVDLSQVGKRALESLIKVGALKGFGERDDLLAMFERIVGFSASHHEAQRNGQMSFFGGDSGLDEKLEVPPAPVKQKFTRREQLGWEKELLGLYVTGRPVDRHRDKFCVMPNLSIVQNLVAPDSTTSQGRKVKIAGEIVSIRELITKNNNQMAILHVEDWHETASTIDVVVFPSIWEKTKNYTRQYKEDKLDDDQRDRLEAGDIEAEDLLRLTDGDIVVIQGKFDSSRNEPQVICESISFEFENLQPDDIIAQANSYGRDYAMHETTQSEMPPPPDDNTYHDNNQPPTPTHTEYARPATQGAATQSGSNGSNGNQTQGNGHHPADSGDNTFDDLLGIEDDGERSTVHIDVRFYKSDDPERDRRKLQRLHRTLVGYPGKNTFALFIVDTDGDRTTVLDFPNHTTGYSEALLRDLVDIVGEDNIHVTDSEEQPDD